MHARSFLTLELLLSVSLLAIITIGVVSWFAVGQQTTLLAGERDRATLLCEEALEAFRNIRDENFFTTADGTYGLTRSGGRWVLSGSSDTTGIFTRSLVISTISPQVRQAVATVTWQQNLQRTGSVQLTTYFTNWHRSTMAADNFYINTGPASVSNKQLQNLILQNTGSFNWTIDKIRVQWWDTGGGNNNSKIAEIKFNNTDRIWSKNGPGSPSGTQQSGTILDVDNYSIVANGGIYTSNYFKFEGNKVYGLDFLIDFYMTDGSIKSTGLFTPAQQS